MTIADRLFTNGSFRTLDPDNPIAEALASWRGRIIGVGARVDLEALTGPDTEVVDLGGATVLPGFIETHMHPIAAGVQILQRRTQPPPEAHVERIGRLWP